MDSLPEKNKLLYKHLASINDPAFADIKHIKFREYKGGPAKIDCIDIPYKKFLKEVADKYRNGALFVDDAVNFERNSISDEMMYLVSMRAHLGIDVMYIYHSLTGLAIDQIPFLNNVILFHTTDNFKYKGAKLPQMELIEQAKERIAKRVAGGDKYYYEVIKLA